MRELHAIVEHVRRTFDAAGYGEIATPALEYESVLGRGSLDGVRPAYRVFDENGEVLVLRFQEQMKLEEIAKLIRIPVATVKTRIYRGVMALRPALKGSAQ